MSSSAAGLSCTGLDGRAFPRVTGGGWQVDGWRVAGSGWRVVGQAVKKKKKKKKTNNNRSRLLPIINITKSDILAILFYTISRARDSLRNS